MTCACTRPRLRAAAPRLLLSAFFSLLLAVAFALVFCTCNTPLGASIGSDNAMYLTMGTALCSGYAPYTQIFDHKGPLLFLLQALPQALGGGYSTLAVFVQEVVFLFLCLRVLDAIARALGAPSLPVQIAYLALNCAYFSGGNLTEEYANLFALVGLYAALCTFGTRNAPLSPDASIRIAPAAVMGACVMLCFLTRANNALALCALVGVLAVCLLVRRSFSALGRCALGFILGCVLAALPIVLWLAACGALGASFYGSILHNIMYTETGDTSRLYMLLHANYGRAAMLMALCSTLGAVMLYVQRRAGALALAMVAGAAAAGLAAFLSHKFYAHYLMLGAPLAALGIAALLAWPKGAMRPISCAALLLVCGAWLYTQGVQANATRLSERADWDTFTEQAQALYAQVPEAERDRFIAYRVEPRWYVAAEALPCMRFYFLQEILGQADPAVMDEIVDTFESDPPLWLVIYYNRAFSPPYDARIAEIFETHYTFVDAQGEYQLLRLIEE